jgi:predicted nucleic acid-binding protein
VPIVVDSSVAACWALPDEFSETANIVLARLANDLMLVPPIFWYEIRNVLVVAERRQRISTEQSVTALTHISAIPPLEDRLGHSDPVMLLARKHRLTVYDAAYLELASRVGASLATLDTKLGVAAAAEGLTVVN